MIYYPIQTLVNAGITDIMIVTGGNSAGDFLKLLGNGKAFGLKHLNYTYQEGEGGIAEALSLVEHFAAKEPVCVVLGDNIIEGNIARAVRSYQRAGQGSEDYFEEGSGSGTLRRSRAQRANTCCGLRRNRSRQSRISR